MLTSSKSIAFLVLLFLLSAGAQAQNDNSTENTAYLDFNVGSNRQQSKKPQSATLFGCNTVYAMDSSNGNALVWNQPGQVINDLPYGHQWDSRRNKKYFISKYYIASPPVFNLADAKAGDPNTKYDIGLVTPDEFKLKGDKPAQLIYLNYDVLKTVYIKYLDIKFDDSFDESADTLVPFKVECWDFPWLDSTALPGAKGASGIGFLSSNSTRPPQLFLPYYYLQNPNSPNDSVRVYLDTKVTILNDILYHYKVFFKVNGKKYTSINLKDLSNGETKLEFHRKYRRKLPCGCKEKEERSRRDPHWKWHRKWGRHH